MRVTDRMLNGVVMLYLIEHGTLDGFFDDCSVTVYAPQSGLDGWSDEELFLACPVDFSEADGALKRAIREEHGGDCGIGLDAFPATWRTVLVAPATWRTVLVADVTADKKASLLRQMREFGIVVEANRIANVLREQLACSPSATMSALWSEERVGDE